MKSTRTTFEQNPNILEINKYLSAVNHSMSVASDVQQNENSSPNLRDRFSLSKVALCNSSSAKALSPNFSSVIRSRNAVEEVKLQHYQA